MPTGSRVAGFEVDAPVLDDLLPQLGGIDLASWYRA